MMENYDKIVEERAQHVFDVMATRADKEDLERLRKAFEFAKDAHSHQRRKSGEPYILHPIAVATTVSDETPVPKYS